MESVDARIRYLSPDWRGRRERPRISTREQRHRNTRFYDVRIEDARPLQERGELSLESCGFVLVPHETKVRDFGDPAEISRSYYPEIRDLILRLTGADDAAILQHVIRREDSKAFNAAYARYVHCDFAPSDAEQLSRRIMVERGLCKADEADRYDWAWYNTWQPIEREVQQNPLVVLDARSVEPSELVEYDFNDDGSAGLASIPFFSSEHRHYYFPRMQTDELLVFKQLESRPGHPRMCPHTSFDDGTSPADALRRRSIEVRSLCLFERGARS